MMFSLSFALVLLIAFNVHGQTNNINTLNPNHPERGYPFGKLRLAEDGKNEELIPSNDIEKSQLNPDQSSGVQPLPSPCIGTRQATKLSYPKDKTKYIQCRDEYHYEIFTCPNGGEYNEQTNSCDLVLPMINKCEDKPCLNDGQCTLLSNSSVKCTCRQDWTGERCETALNSCVKKPCGPNAECRSLKTSDYDQDYVCICHGRQGYGLNCQEVVPNPCLTTGEQFFPYAFSQRAYIQCDAELIHFQPCGPTLYWHQAEKVCERKRPPKMESPNLFKKLVSNTNDDDQREKVGENIKEEITVTTTVQTDEQNSFGQRSKQENEDFVAFVPARVANRQQLLSDINNQQGMLNQNLDEKEQNNQDLSNSNQGRQDFMSKPNQWPIQQQWVPTSTEGSFIGANIGEAQNGQDQQQQQNSQQENQGFGTQQWLNQVPDMQTQNNQRFIAQPQSWQGSQTFQNQNTREQDQSWKTRPATQLGGSKSSKTIGSQQQSWQGSQTIQNQPIFQNRNQQMFVETSTAVPFQGFQNQNTRDEDQSWKTRPATQLGGSQSSKTIGSQPQAWQGSPIVQNQPRFQDQNQQTFLEPIKSTTLQNVINSQGFQNQNTLEQEQTWQNKPTTQVIGNQLPQSVGINTQNFVAQPQSWKSSQTIQNQPWSQDQNPQMFVETTTVTQNVAHLQGFQKQNPREQEQTWQNKPTTQIIGNQLPQSTGSDTQSFLAQPQTWQPSQSFQSQQPLASSNLEGTAVDTKNRLNTGLQQNNQQSWPKKGNNQFRQNLIQSEVSLIDVQQLPFNKEQPSTDQSTQDQQQTQTLNPDLSFDLNNVQLQKEIQSPMKQDNSQQQNLPQQQQNQAFGTQKWLNQVPDVKTQNNQRFVAQPQSWQGSQTIQKQPIFQNQNQQIFVETSTTTPQNVIPFQDFQNQNTREQEQSWQNKLPNQQTLTQPIKSQSNQVFAFKPTQWTESTKQNQEINIPTSQSWSQRQNQQPLIADSSSQIQNTQFGLNQQQKGLPVQTSFDQTQPWSNNQQLQKSQLTNFGDLKLQIGRPVISVQTQPWSQTGQLTANSFETTTIANRALPIQNLRGRQPSWPVEQRQQDNNQIGQQTTTTAEQRKPLDSVPTVFSGLWTSRS